MTAIETELERVRRRGYGEDLEEFCEGVCCLGAPFFAPDGSRPGSLSVSVPSFRYRTRARRRARRRPRRAAPRRDGRARQPLTGECPLAKTLTAPAPARAAISGIALLRTMIRIRVLEEGIEKHFLAGDIPGFAHLSIGQEAVAAGTCANLRADDAIASTHRGHGHTLAKGTSMRGMVAELFARATGICKGKGGSMHIADFSVGMLGANGVVAGGFGLVAGAALSAVQRKTDQVAVCFFGDGATNRGPFHENLNLCAVWNLPAIFVLENNRYASTTSTAETMKIADVAMRADGLRHAVGDRRRVRRVRGATTRSARRSARARSGGGPTFVECKTYRARGHYIGDPERYREKREIEDVMSSSDPIVRMQGLLGDALAAAEFETLWAQAREEFADAVAFARSSPSPRARRGVLRRVHRRPRRAAIPCTRSRRASATRSCPSRPSRRRLAGQRAISMARTDLVQRATLEAMQEEMRRDPTVFLMGEDIAKQGGIFGQFKGLPQEFGFDRVRDTPISEAALVGAGVGAALTGCRPVVDMHFADFITCAMDEVVNQAAKLRYMFGEQCVVPMTLRAPDGITKSAGSQHSQALEGWFVHTPGLEVVVPADAEDAKGLLKAAIRSDNPTLYFEHKALFPQKGAVPDDDDFVVPIGKAKTMRDGSDVAIVTYGITVGRAMEAASAARGGRHRRDGDQPAHRVAARLRCDRGRRRADASGRGRARSRARRRRRRRDRRVHRRALLRRARRAGAAARRRARAGAVRAGAAGSDVSEGADDRRRRAPSGAARDS